MRNFKHIITTKPGNLLPIEGLRALMMMQIVAIHTIAFHFWTYISNHKVIEEVSLVCDIAPK